MTILKDKKDYEDLHTLLRIEESILETYHKLSELEIDDRKNSNEYQVELNHLSSTLKLEENLLSNIEPNKIIAYIEYLSKAIFEKGIAEDEIDVIVNNITNLLPLQRTIKKLKINSISSISEPLKNANPEDFFLDTEEELKHVASVVDGATAVYKSLANDEWILLIHLINKKILNPLYKQDRNLLIRSKYNFSYSEPYIEKALYPNNFNVSGDIYFSTDLVASIYHMPLKILTFIKRDYAFDIYKKQEEKLLTINNAHFMGKSLEITIRQNIMRIAFQLLTDDEITFLNEKFHEKVDNDRNIAIEYEQSIEAIKTAFRHYNKDKELIKKISLNR